MPENEDEETCARQMFLLTTKPVLYVCNVDDSSAATGNAYVEQVREAIKDEDAQLMIISAQTEADIAELETYEEKQMFLEDLGLKESGCNRLIKAIYKLLNLHHCRRNGGEGMDLSQRLEGSAMRRCYPYRLREGLHPRRGHQVRRLYKIW